LALPFVAKEIYIVGGVIKSMLPLHISIIDIEKSQAKSFQMIEQLFRKATSLSESPPYAMSQHAIVALYSHL
jgi:hypothetical protein